jgi:hypothetical protein
MLMRIDLRRISRRGVTENVTHLLWKDKGFYREQGKDREKYRIRINELK